MLMRICSAVHSDYVRTAVLNLNLLGRQRQFECVQLSPCR